MPRQPRRLLPGGYYHLINRGNDRAVVFRAPAEYRSFMALIDAAREQFQLRLLAYCLMPNHFHLVVSPQRAGDVSRGMHWLMTTHTHRHHLRHGTSGSVWQGRFKAFQVKHDGHLLTVVRYVERNALRAGLVRRAEQWNWGSLAERLENDPTGRLSALPTPLPPDWPAWVNEAQTPSELEALRQCVNRQQPFGDDAWIAESGAGHPRGFAGRSRGRPPKKK